MDGGHDRRALAIGLMRKAAQLLEQAGDDAGVASVRAAVTEILHAQPLPDPGEMDPDAATLIAAIPLSDQS